jgi:predicted DNA-binding transcriptional regulator YafY
MASANTLPRILYVHAAIKNGEVVNTQTIKERFGGSRRTAYRTIAYLRDQLHAPVEFDPRRNSYYYVDPAYELPTIPLSHGEAISILLVYQSMLERLPLPLARELAAAVVKLEEFLPRTLSVNFSDLAPRVSAISDPLRSVSVEHLDRVREALEGRRTLRLRYYTASRDELLERDVDPYHLTYRRGDWYVVGWCHLRRRVQTFAVSRIRGISPLRGRFEIPASFDVREYFEYAFGIDNAGAPCRVVVEFDLPEARYIGERSWHPSQKLRPLADGRLQIELLLALNYELRQWILSYGSRVTVVEPAELVAQIGGELGRAAARYAAS